MLHRKFLRPDKGESAGYPRIKIGSRTSDDRRPGPPNLLLMVEPVIGARDAVIVAADRRIKLREWPWRFRLDSQRKPVLVEAQSSDGPPFVLTLKSIGNAVSVETREEDRVSTSGNGLTATIEDEGGCPVQDVSLSGLAAIATRIYAVGQSVEILIPFGGQEYVGQVEVRCANALDDGKTRYGFLGVLDTTEGKNLQGGLTRITLEIQQQHLKRISGSG